MEDTQSVVSPSDTNCKAIATSPFFATSGTLTLTRGTIQSLDYNPVHSTPFNGGIATFHHPVLSPLSPQVSHAAILSSIATIDFG